MIYGLVLHEHCIDYFSVVMLRFSVFLSVDELVFPSTHFWGVGKLTRSGKNFRVFSGALGN